nr:hypothetical protein HK105_001589 [Polyrhizophydium stewartii]
MVALPPEQHIERDERGVRKASDPSSYRFPCTMCDRAFTRKYNLDAHLLVHQNIKPYKCMHSGCTEAFVRKYDLKRHDRTIHERRSFARCPHCSLVLARSDSFRKHTRICTSLTGQGRAVLSNGDESSDDGSFTADTDAASTSSRGTKRKG